MGVLREQEKSDGLCSAALSRAGGGEKSSESVEEIANISEQIKRKEYGTEK